MRLTIILILALLLQTNLHAKKKGSPPMAANAPGDRTCLTSKCHAGNDLNTDKATIEIRGLPVVYTPGEIYEITLHLEQAKAKKFGFQTTVADTNGQASGTLAVLDDQKTQLLDNTRYKTKTNRQYLTHTLKGITGPHKGQSPIWKVQWQAPAEANGPASFFFAFNAANGNKKKTGDYIYTRSFAVMPASN